MRVCNRCGQAKDPEEFSARGGKKQPWCRECNRAYAREYYRNNQTKLKSDINQLRRARVAANRQFLLAYLSSRSCADCGENDPIVLEFDHVRGKKRYLISSLIHEGYSLQTLMKEIEKCDVVCANCHRRRTARTFGTYRLIEI